jgi:uncharacterized protein YndB with AHSA1/START domain
MTAAADARGPADRELLITRVFDAPRALVYRIWTDPQHMKHWWGPRGYTTLSCEVDLRTGGAWRVESRHTDGSETAEQGVFREIVEPERLVLTHAWDDQHGKPGHETLVTVTFVEEDGKTKMTFHQAGFTSTEIRDGHVEGWNESFDMLAEHLASV